MNELTKSPSWKSGSVEHFRGEWIRQQTASSFIYPRQQPRTQWDAFEYLKANVILQMVQKAVPQGGRILEYGCGAAGILIFLTNHGYKGVALDATREALTIARMNDTAEGAASRNSRTAFVGANALSMPFPDATFDCVVSNGLLEHFSPEIVPVLLAEINRVLKPGGLFVADIAHSRFSTRQIAKLYNFAISYSAQIIRRRGFGFSKIWRLLSTPMYENDFDRRDWHRALVRAGLLNVDVRGFRLVPPLSLPHFLDTWYGRAVARTRPLRWAASVQSHDVPFGWVYLTSGIKP